MRSVKYGLTEIAEAATLHSHLLTPAERTFALPLSERFRRRTRFLHERFERVQVSHRRPA